jgi:argininosuccinate synthase
MTPLMTTWPQHSSSAGPDRFSVRFAAGRPVSINGRPVTLVEAISAANLIGGHGGIPPLSVVENRVNGTKCRGVYEAPGLELLGRCLSYLYQVCLDKPAAALLRSMSGVLSTAIYEGRMHDQASSAARAAADLLARTANGNIEVEIYRGSIVLRGIDDSPMTARQTRFGGGGHQWRTE